MTQDQLNAGKDLEEKMAICNQILRVMKSDSAFPDARFAMIKDSSMHYIVDLPKEIKNGIVELVENHLYILEQQFEKL